MYWPWGAGLQPDYRASFSSILFVSVSHSPLHTLSEIPLVGRKCDPTNTQRYVHTTLYHPATSMSPKSPPTTSGFQFPVSHCPHAISDGFRVWETWHRPQHFQRFLIINMLIPTELSDIYSPVSGDLCLESLGFSSVAGTACALHVVTLQ